MISKGSETDTFAKATLAKARTAKGNILRIVGGMEGPMVTYETSVVLDVIH
jgi:hypothetical protein